jgi:hypothetical protein
MTAMSRPFIEKFTLAGRLLFVSTMFLAAGGIVLYIVCIWDSLGPGNYPLIIFVVPVALGALLYFGLGLAVCKLLSIRVWKEPEELTDHENGE